MGVILAEIIGDHLLACGDAERAQVILRRALQQGLAQQYPGGRTALLDGIHAHLASRELRADEASRLWIRAVMIVVQTEMQPRI